MWNPLKKIISFRSQMKKRLATEQNVGKSGQAGMGESVMALSINALIEQMSSKYPEWKGLFTVTPMVDHVLVKCHKGFGDMNTR